MALTGPDLTQRPPRSPRVRLGGYVILPRMLDKGRATLAGKNGEFHYNCPLDQHFVNFVKIDPEALKAELAKGSGDLAILEWMHAKGGAPRPLHEILAWSGYQERRAPMDLESRHSFNEYHAKMAPQREDIATWFDLLDIDDYVTFGGQP